MLSIIPHKFKNLKCRELVYIEKQPNFAPFF